MIHVLMCQQQIIQIPAFDIQFPESLLQSAQPAMEATVDKRDLCASPHEEDTGCGFAFVVARQAH